MSKKGWYSKYHITKSDGSPCDPSAVYMVLRLDTDPHARAAANTYARGIAQCNPELSYSKGMEDAFVVYYSCNLNTYSRLFKSESMANDFINKSRKINNEDEIYEEPAPVIKTLEGWHVVSPGDYIITGVKGERYPCKPDIFLKTYEPAE